MLSLWYIILGWKEYNKLFVKQEKLDLKSLDPPKKPDLIPRKLTGQRPDVQKPEASKPVVSQSADVPKPSLPKDIPKVPETQKLSELPKGPPKIPERPDVSDRNKISLPKISNKKDAPKTPKTPNFPEPPKTEESFKGILKNSGLPKSNLIKPNSSSKDANRSSILGGNMPSKRQEYVNQINTEENPSVGPSVSGNASNFKHLTKEDELFAFDNNLKRQTPKPSADLKDLSYEKGEMATAVLDSAGKKSEKQVPVSKIPKYLEESTVSNPDSLDSSEEDEEKGED